MSRFWYLCTLARKSAWNRKGSLALVVLSIALSAVLLVGIERVRVQVRASFIQSVSGADLLVGARGSGLQLLLYAVFHLGAAAGDMSWAGAQRIAAKNDVAWAVPLSLGDSHKGFPVVATTREFFIHYRHQRDKKLHFDQGEPFAGIFDVVLGAQVAKKTGYALGEKITLSHGSGKGGHTEHDDKAFAVTGILAPTGTPVDNSLYISLESMEALHLDWQGGAPIPGFRVQAEHAAKFNLTPKRVSALLVGLKHRVRVFAVQRDVNNDAEEALTAVMPGVVLDQLWDMLNTGESALLLVSWMATAVGLAGLVAVILAGLGERRRELAILRAAGAGPWDIVHLLALEGMLLMLAGVVCGLAALCALVAILGPVLAENYGMGITLTPLEPGEWKLVGGIMAAGFLASLIPALQAYRMSLTDGLSVTT
ncbi:MAG: ABC transporter permease [Deltaproteobacteria bacterium]|jgi:putative ABC transport system permease protein|nr:ABC transporter permease [Deltaproteobacteria bacterium]